jgi:molecular chaperone GrpE
MTFRQLDEVLGSIGVERIDALGQRFDPSQHEAIGSVESEEDEEDTVVGELRPGYRIHDKVLRPTLVRVARRPS